MTLVWLAAAVVLAIVVLLASVLQLRLAASEEGATFELRWLLVMLGVDTRAQQFHLSVLHRTIVRRGITGPGRRKGSKSDRKPRRKRSRRRISLAELLSERRSAVELLHYLWRHLRWRRFKLRLIVATPDPALTGELFGYLSALTGPLATYLPAGSLEVSLDFMAERPSGEVELAAGIRVFVLAALGWHVLRVLQRVMRPA